VPGAAALDGGPAARAAVELLAGLSVAQSFRCPAFWKVFLGYLAINFGSLSLLLNLSPVLVSTGIAMPTANWIYGFSGFSTIAGRIFGGWLVDRAPARFLGAVTAAGMCALPVILLLLPGSVPGAFAALIVFSLMGGGLAPCIAYLISRHIGSRSFATMYQTTSMASALTIGLGPLGANYIYDQVHSYRPVMLAAIPLVLIGALLMAWTGRYPDFAKHGGDGDGR